MSDDRTQRWHDDDATRANDEDATRYIDEDDATRAMPADEDLTRPITSDDATQVMGAHAHDEPVATRPLDPVGAAPRQVTERIHMPAARSGVAAWLIATMVVIALIVGGVLGYMQGDASDDDVVARALVGPDGGVLTFDGSGRLEVPRGALPTATAIVVRRERLDSRVRLGTADDPRSRVYEPGELEMYAFEPAELRFQQPVTITLPRGGDGEAVLVDSEDGARVIAAEPKDDTVTLRTRTFSFDEVP